MKVEQTVELAPEEEVTLAELEGVEMTGDDEDVVAIGSGGGYATAAARALLAHSDLGAAEIVTEALGIAADLCIHTNREIWVETVT